MVEVMSGSFLYIVDSNEKQLLVFDTNRIINQLVC